jgi:hypothetical protein
MEVFEETKTRWLAIELEGRLISSLVACAVVFLVQREQNAAAVGLLALSNAFDLLRCTFRKHSLTHAIWIHHTLVMALSIA